MCVCVYFVTHPQRPDSQAGGVCDVDRNRHGIVFSAGLIADPGDFQKRSL